MNVRKWAVAAVCGTNRRRADAPSCARPMVLVLLTIAPGLAGCGRGHAPQTPTPGPSLAPIAPMARLYYDNGGGIQDSTRVVVRDAAAFAKVWQRATSQQTEPPPVPTVDFDRQMVLVTGSGRMTPEDQITVDSVGVRKETAEGKTRDVLMAYVRTTEGCHRFRAAAYPLEIVQVRRFDGPVRFAETRVKPTTCR